jgi:heme-degrading monooxygenase HmoA
VDDGCRLDRSQPGAARVIVRSWSARLEPRHVAEYVGHFERSVKPTLTILSGFVDAVVLERRLDPSTPLSEVVVQTRWQSLDAIHAFAGGDISVAVVDPEAIALFSDYDHHVVHYDVIG